MKTVYLMTFFILFILLTNLYSSGDQFDSLVQSLEETYSRVKDYKCLFYKKELVDGNYIEQDNIISKFKKPKFYYMNWTEGSREGMEVIYAGNKYNNNLRVHLGGLMEFIDIEINPKGSMAMRGNRHSIFESDIGFIISLIKNNYEKSKLHSDGKFWFVKDTILDNRTMKIYKAMFPDGKDFYCHIIYVYIDTKLNLPLIIVAYDWNKTMIEKYYYKDVKINVGLKDIDFDADNPRYNY
ncbi:DUF1571 domain-containing protein [Bacteroidota bacterium]